MKAQKLVSDRHGRGEAPTATLPRPAPPAEPASAGTAAASSLPPFLRHLVGAVDRANDALLLVLALGIGVLACLAFAQVISRYVLGAPLTWSEEVIRYALIWTVFLGAGVAVRKGLMVAVEVVVHLVPDPVRRVMGWVVTLVSGAFWLILLVYGIIILDAVQGMRSGAVEMPMAFIYLAVPIGAAIALVNTLVVAVDPPVPTLEGTID